MATPTETDINRFIERIKKPIERHECIKILRRFKWYFQMTVVIFHDGEREGVFIGSKKEADSIDCMFELLGTPFTLESLFEGNVVYATRSETRREGTLYV